VIARGIWLVLLVIVLVQLQQGGIRQLAVWFVNHFLNSAAAPPKVPTVPGKVQLGGGAAGGAGGWTRPLNAPTISPFGVPRDGGRTHEGADIGGRAWKGKAVGAVRHGTVLRAGWADGRCGLRVAVDHGDAESIYCHLDRVDVRTGDKVDPGQQLGTCGNTGNAAGTEPHVHLEIHPGGYKNPVDPEQFLPPYAATRAGAVEMIPEGVPVGV